MNALGIRITMCATEPYRGHPRNGLLPAAFRSGVRSVSEKLKRRKCKILFKNRYLFVIPAYAVLRSQITASNAECADDAEKLALERYGQFEASRRDAARLAVDQEDVATLEQVERQLESKGRGGDK